MGEAHDESDESAAAIDAEVAGAAGGAAEGTDCTGNMPVAAALASHVATEDDDDALPQGCAEAARVAFWGEGIGDESDERDWPGAAAGMGIGCRDEMGESYSYIAVAVAVVTCEVDLYSVCGPLLPNGMS